jgi:Bacterial pre-peptidase C-terminal domain
MRYCAAVVVTRFKPTMLTVCVFLGVASFSAPVCAAELQKGIPATNLSASTGTTLNYTFEVPAGATSLTFQISGGSGDADLYVRYGAAPTTSSYDCRPYVGGNNETCAMTPTAGTWYVMVRAYASFSNVSLVATYTTGGGGGITSLEPAVPTGATNGGAGQTFLYSITVPPAASNLIFQMIGTVGDADLYVRYGAAPTTSAYDCRPYTGTSNETCAMPSATGGTWYVMVRGYAAFAGMRLLATYATAGGNISVPPPVPAAAVCVSTPRENVVTGALPCPDGTNEQCGNFSIIQNGSKGTATIVDVTSGQYQYTPQGTTWGVDTFEYVANDVSSVPHEATAVVIVRPRVMPLGDSITAGITNGTTPDVPVRVGYRKPLFDALQASGYLVDLVGTQNFGYSVANFDPDNEAHPGWTSSEIVFGTSYPPYQDPNCPTCKLLDWLNAKRPDVILLHIGTNGFTTDATNVSAILNTINLWSTGSSGNPVAVFLAQIINRNPYQSVDVLGYDQNLVALVANRLSAGVGPTTYLVDQESALVYPADLLSDPVGLHPDANGYARMANRWFTSLLASGLMPKCP